MRQAGIPRRAFKEPRASTRQGVIAEMYGIELATNQEERPVVGYIGLGRAGQPIAHNFIKAGYSLRVFDVDRERLEAMVRLGAVPTEGPGEVGKASSITFLSLPHPAISEEVILGPDGLLQASAEGSIIVELSTIPPSLVSKINTAAVQRRVSLVDAGIAGNIPRAAIARELIIMAGGTEDAFQKVLPLFKATAKQVYHVGPWRRYDHESG